MDRVETLKIMAVLRTAYPAYYGRQGAADADNAAKLWQCMFQSEPYAVVEAAVRRFLATDTKGFPPVIGQIKEQIRQITRPEDRTEQEAWSLVARALRNGIYGAQEEFDRLPEDVQRIVNSPEQLREWAMMDADTVQSVVASNFQRSYRARAAATREWDKLPEPVRQMHQQFANAVFKPMLNEGGAE